MAMGISASPVLANLVINYLLSNIPFEVSLLKLYVDDTIMIIPGDKIDFVLSKLIIFFL